ncbi:MAG TPA: hypothetical protein VFS21_35740 [Roseiflexaceae bacterium]|nr:hypothetical protein [Roseiflexaceae bacterium]
MSLPFDPACLPLLLGGLPHHSPAQALELTRRHAGTLLAWPQLPQLGLREQPITQSAAGFPGLVLDEQRGQLYVNRARAEEELNRLALAYLINNTAYGALGTTDALGLEALLQQRATLRGVRALKGQLLGPLSTAAQLTDEKQRPLMYDPHLFEALTQHTRLRAAWQEARLGELHGTTIICLDEPFLELVGLPFSPLDWDAARVSLDEVFGGIIGCKALYAGGAVDWTRVLQTAVELIIADAYHHGAALVAAGAALGDFLRRGGLVGLGLVPADADELRQAEPPALLSRLEPTLVGLEAAGIPRALLLRQAVVTPAAALATLDIPAAEQALLLLAQTSALLRETYGLEA